MAEAWVSSRLGALSRAIDERVNLKHVHRRLQAVAKVLIVTTFVEDALRVLLTFSVQQNSMRIAGWQSPVLHSGLPIFSFVVQMGGALLVVQGRTGVRAQIGVVMLLCWCLFHPIMYRQETNWEFVLETLTIMGGLLVLLSHCMLVEAAAAARATPRVSGGNESLPKGAPRIVAAKAVGPSPRVEGPAAARAHAVQALGRLLIVSVFLYYAFIKVHDHSLINSPHTTHHSPLTTHRSPLILIRPSVRSFVQVHGYAPRVGRSLQNYDWATPMYPRRDSNCGLTPLRR